MSKHRAEPASWIPLAAVAVVLVVGIGTLIAGLGSVRFGSAPAPTPTVTVQRPYRGPTPTVTVSYLIVVTATPGVGGF